MAVRHRLVVAMSVLALTATACSGPESAADQASTAPAPTAAPHTAATDADQVSTETTVLDDGPATTESSAPTDPGSSATETTRAGFEVGDCPAPVPNGFDVTCGRLYVPENRSLPDSPEIGLAVAIVHPDGPVAGTPVVYLEGGPGGSALDGFFTDPESWDYPFLEGRDLVLLDQRGAGYSLPTLDCPELAGDALPGEAERACFDRLTAEGIDLTAYSTEANADDVADLQAALGIGEWDLFGISYGTRLAMEVMRRHGGGVGAVVLDSPYPPNVDLAVDQMFAFVDVFEQLLADCSADAYCAETYPDLADTFLDTVGALNAEQGEVFGDDLAVAVSQAFQDGQAGLVPWVVFEVAAGNLGALDEIAGAEDGFARFQTAEDVSDSEGMYFSVQCGDFAVGDESRAEEAAVGAIPGELESYVLQEAFDLARVCEYWNPLDAVDDSPVVSDIPTLILVGAYDTATPPRWAEFAAEGLTSAYVIVVPGAGHSVVTTAGSCPIQIIGDFLADPTVPPDDSCIAGIEWPYFE